MLLVGAPCSANSISLMHQKTSYMDRIQRIALLVHQSIYFHHNFVSYLARLFDAAKPNLRPTKCILDNSTMKDICLQHFVPALTALHNAHPLDISIAKKILHQHFNVNSI